jgi:ribosomal protein L4
VALLANKSQADKVVIAEDQVVTVAKEASVVKEATEDHVVKKVVTVVVIAERNSNKFKSVNNISHVTTEAYQV